VLNGYVNKKGDPFRRMVLYSTPDGGKVWVDAVGDPEVYPDSYPEDQWQCVGPVVEYLGDNGRPIPGVLVPVTVGRDPSRVVLDEIAQRSKHVGVVLIDPDWERKS